MSGALIAQGPGVFGIVTISNNGKLKREFRFRWAVDALPVERHARVTLYICVLFVQSVE
jgi:hypothetical protein